MDTIDYIFRVFIILVCGIPCILIIFGLFKQAFSLKKSVHAKLIDKFVGHSVRMSKYNGAVEDNAYVLIFSAEKKELRFSVSAGVYDWYHKGQEGLLRYKGRNFLDFDKEFEQYENHSKRKRKHKNK